MKEVKNKISTKDKIIIGLTIAALILLLLLIFLARKNDRIITETLVESEKMVKEDIASTEDGVMQSALILTEVNGDKWIEIYNNSNADYDISGYSVYLSGEKIAEIEDGSKALKNDFYVLELNANPGKNDGAFLSLRNRKGEDVLSSSIPKLNAGQSYGRRTKDSNELGYVTSSKGKENENPDDFVMVNYGGIGISSPGGFYNTEFDLTLEASDGEKIYYTLDGTEPTVESTLYEEPIRIKSLSGGKYVYATMAVEGADGVYLPGSIDKGMILRAIKVDASGNITGSTTQSYYVGLLRKSEYANLPVLSIVAEPHDLFDYFDGMYIGGRAREDGVTQGNNWNGNFRLGWTRNAKIEYFEPGRGKSLESDVVINIFGDDYKSYRQKGFKIKISEEEYNGKFAGSSILDSIDARNYLTLSTHYNDSDMKIRDYVINSLIEDSKVTNGNFTPCIVFIDGEFWGLYSFVNSWDEKYIRNKYEINGGLDIYNANDYSPVFEDLYEFVVLNDMSDRENYSTFKSMCDIDSYLQYMCFNIYVGNYLYNSKTGLAWRTSEKGTGTYDDGRWRWGLPGMDLTMGIKGESSYSIDTFLFPNYANDPFLNSLLMNKEFCDSLVKTMDEISTNYFSEDRYTEVIDKYSSLLKKPVIASRNRFYGGYNDKVYSDGVDIIKKYLDNRYYYISIYTKEVAEKGGDINVIQAERDRINGVVPEQAEQQQ
ncbi:CotH kinase family protein [Butyrivibrio sp.]|uniref:CotH kinase family protein n=1 Tax=Butyrivibrio sp. TaxID=28121 RepID=UPI0025BF01D7|nr:CotH kinase family protein [Butyrivibrio sp.]MBE5837296.1 hypothetical protein [Butyrivibrio sp.]